MSKEIKFRTRQAPSPTGYLHLGTARTVLFTSLLTKVNQGEWYLRLEDTDRNRLQADSVQNLLSTLGQLGLTPNEGIQLDLNPPQNYNDFYKISQSGDRGPYIQSERLDLYHYHAQKLLDMGLAYWSYTTPKEKGELQEIKKINKKAIDYYQHNLENYGQESLQKNIQEGLKDKRKPILRYRLKRDKSIVCHDLLLGQTKFDLNLEEDFNILKSDGFPTYHLAHLVDDHLMQTTLIIRGQEWYPSISRHVTMFRDYWGNLENLDFDPQSANGKGVPDYLHLPFILAQEGNKKMSKRDGNVNMAEYLEEGYLPEALINYLAFLGWNPGTDKELYLQKEDF